MLENTLIGHHFRPLSSAIAHFGEDASRLVERLPEFFNFAVELMRTAAAARTVPAVGGTIAIVGRRPDGFNCHFEVLYGLLARLVKPPIGLYQIKVLETCLG